MQTSWAVGDIRQRNKVTPKVLKAFKWLNTIEFNNIVQNALVADIILMPEIPPHHRDFGVALGNPERRRFDAVAEDHACPEQQVKAAAAVLLAHHDKARRHPCLTLIPPVAPTPHKGDVAVLQDMLVI